MKKYQIDSIKNYLDKSKEKEFYKVTKEIYLMTEHLNKRYPGYKEWFYNKQLQGCIAEKRNIIFIRNSKNKITVISSLKKEEEKKICTLFVDSEYRKHGIGDILIEESLKYLETTKPLITINEDKIPMFEKIIEKYNWQLTEILNGIYTDSIREFCFNGRLSKNVKHSKTLK